MSRAQPPRGDSPEPGHTPDHPPIEEALAPWRAMVDALREPALIHDREGRILHANDAYGAQAGTGFEKVIGAPYWEVFPRREGPLASCDEEAKAVNREHRERITTPTGHTFLSHAIAVADDQGQFRFALHVLEDLSESTPRTEELGRLNRALRIISGGNRVMLRAGTEQEVLDGVCRTAVEEGGLRLAWVGVARRDPDCTVEPLAAAGPAAAYLEAITVTWADSPEGQGPTGRAIREDRPVSAQDITRDPRYEPWREVALEHGFKASLALPLHLEDGVWGTLNLYAEEPFAFSDLEIDLLSELATDLAYGLQYRRTEEAYRQQAARATKALEGTVRALAQVTEYSDPYTAGHQGRVAELGRAIAETLGWDQEAAWGVEMGGWVHDIGKMAIPTGILNKSGPLSPQEFELIKTHCGIGRDMVAGIDFPWPVAAMIHQHHERTDGSGYPQGLTGEQMVPEARILAVADVMEAMCAHRPYRPALGVEQALAAIEQRKGTGFDPEVVAACVHLFRDKGFAFSNQNPGT